LVRKYIATGSDKNTPPSSNIHYIKSAASFHHLWLTHTGIFLFRIKYKLSESDASKVVGKRDGEGELASGKIYHDT
jgi:hypothetical protein